MRDGHRADVVVVGGGLAGLTAAAVVAQAGRRVVVLERSSALGGRAATATEKGFHLNLGPHAWYMGGPGTSVLTRLGIPIEGRAPRPSGSYAIAGNRLHALPIGFVSLLTTDLLGIPGKLDFARLLATLPRLDSGTLDRLTVDEWLDRSLSDARARALVNMYLRIASYADAPRLLSAAAAVRSLQIVVKDRVQYLDGGWQRLVQALAARVEGGGGEIRRSSPVHEVLHDERVSGVRLESGDVIRTDAVVLALDPGSVRRLVPGLDTSSWHLLPARAACLDLGLARLPTPDTIAAFGVEQPLYFSVHSATAALAPAGQAVVHVAKYLDPSHRSDPKADERQLEAMADLVQPGWRREVVVRRFLPAMTVSHAIPLAGDGGLAGRPGVEPVGVRGVFLAGDWVGAEGMLANAAVASAARAARLALQQVQPAAAVA